MHIEARYGIAACIIGIATLVLVPMVLVAQPSSTNDVPKQTQVVQRTFTAPPASFRMSKPVEREPNPLTALDHSQNLISDVEPRIEIIEMKSGNRDHLTPGFYATFKPKAFDTIFIYDGETDHYEVIDQRAGKEVIQGDSSTVAEEVSIRMNHIDGRGLPIMNEKRGKSNTMIIRSGFIPAQGFGSKRYRFAIKPGQFTLSNNSMISASVHLLGNSNIGTILCAVTSIDCDKGIFYVETSNEVPRGENINWIIINSP